MEQGRKNMGWRTSTDTKILTRHKAKECGCQISLQKQSGMRKYVGNERDKEEIEMMKL